MPLATRETLESQLPRSYTLGKRTESVAGTRAAIMEALNNLTSRSPYQHITLKQIAEEADVAEKTVHRHFPSKDAILVALTSDRVRAGHGRLGPWRDTTDPAAAFERLVRAVYTQYEESGGLCWSFITAVSSSEEIAKEREVIRRVGDDLASSLVDAWPDAWRVKRERASHIIAGSLRFVTWMALRKEWGLTHEESIAVTTGAVRRMLSTRAAAGPAE